MGCLRNKIGSPIWDPRGAIVVLAAIGPRGQKSSVLGWLSSFFAGTHEYYASTNVFGPNGSEASRSRHQPPYELEMLTRASEFLPRALVHRQAFTAREYTTPSGIMLLFNLIPTGEGPTGPAVEFDSGPIIPNELFPLGLNVDIFYGEQVVFSSGDSSYPGYDMITEELREDGLEVYGASHVMMMYPANDTYTGLLTGNFEYRITITDSDSYGWNVVVPYAVQ
jgi:hypothetical protein